MTAQTSVNQLLWSQSDEEFPWQDLLLFLCSRFCSGQILLLSCVWATVCVLLPMSTILKNLLAAWAARRKEKKAREHWRLEENKVEEVQEKLPTASSTELHQWSLKGSPYRDPLRVVATFFWAWCQRFSRRSKDKHWHCTWLQLDRTRTDGADWRWWRECWEETRLTFKALNQTGGWSK